MTLSERPDQITKAIEIAWRSVRHAEFFSKDVTLEQFDSSIRRMAECKAIVNGEEVVGLAAYAGNEIDVYVDESRKGRWASRSFLRSLLAPIFEKSEHATTRVHVTNEASRKIVEGVGFKPICDESGWIRYAMFKEDFRFGRV